MIEEYEAFFRNNTWSLIPLHSGRKVIGCKWLFRLKLKPSGDIERYKVRLVVQRFNQDYGVDCFKTFSPIVKPTTNRIVLTIAMSNGWVICQLDVRNGLLNGELTEELYMRQPVGFVNSSHPNHVLLLKKAPYGLKKSPQAWFSKFSTCLM